ncbi:hypothetical protein K9L05_02290 [Candidatus Babeliales bacterium]|nr:hypothetical protein [Candidatus Babeliales bacterium]MCF7899456.1 hypothetical protein [Candidatus Babeliales bacterium]
MKNIARKFLFSVFLILFSSTIYAMQDQEASSNHFEERYVFSNFKESLYVDFLNLIKKEKFVLIKKFFEDCSFGGTDESSEIIEINSIEYINRLFEDTFYEIFHEDENLFLHNDRGQVLRQNKPQQFALKIIEKSNNILHVNNDFISKLKKCVSTNLNKFVPQTHNVIANNVARTTGNMVQTTYYLPENVNEQLLRVTDLTKTSTDELQTRSEKIMINDLAKKIKIRLSRIAANCVTMKYNDPLLGQNTLCNFLESRENSDVIESQIKIILENYFFDSINANFVVYQQNPKGPEYSEFKKRIVNPDFIYKAFLDIASENSDGFWHQDFQEFISNQKTLLKKNFIILIQEQLNILEQGFTNWRQKLGKTFKFFTKYGPQLYVLYKSIPFIPRLIQDTLKNPHTELFNSGLLVGGFLITEFALHKIWTKGICS